MNTKVSSRSRLNSEQDYDANLLQFATYKNNLSDPAIAPINEQCSYEIRSSYVFVSSGDRDINSYPNVNSFQVPIGLKEVYSVTLLGGVIPNVGGVDLQPFLMLDIPEINHVTSLGTSSGLTSIIQFASHSNPSSFFNIDGGISAVSPIIFRPVKNRMDKLTIKIKNADGAMTNLGTGLSPANQILLQFRIDCRVCKEGAIYRDFRNV